MTAFIVCVFAAVVLASWVVAGLLVAAGLRLARAQLSYAHDEECRRGVIRPHHVQQLAVPLLVIQVPADEMISGYWEASFDALFATWWGTPTLVAFIATLVGLNIFIRWLIRLAREAK